ncbi:MAG TPA: arginine--tRNA ligase [Porticoccaceae bacterium]|nr:arginine--tRNA ligase [Porticoccaceae bacterium]
MNIPDIVEQKLLQAMVQAGIPEHLPARVVASSKPEFGDFQANGIMAAGKQLGQNPRELANAVISYLDLTGIAEQVEVAGPGFINIHLADAFLSHTANQLYTQDRTSGGRSPDTLDSLQTIVVDYSSPNLAKEMHVGHLRSTIIGDAMARILEYLGHKVIRQNHMGDWGTQFGMLIAELEEQVGEGEQPELALKDLESFYQKAKSHFDQDADFADKARNYVVRLQSGDAHCLALWQRFIDISIAHSEAIYQQLGVTLQAGDIHPESAYNDDLETIVSKLDDQGLATEDQGAVVVFLEELADKKGKPSPVIVRKSDGGYLYATTDLAALAYRSRELKADRIIYFIDARQSLHMKQVFTLARKAGLVADTISLEHMAFGTMMGADGKPFKTRSGGTVKLEDLLTEAVERAGALIKEKNPELKPGERVEVARKVGIGAVKYADLSKTRTNDYQFDWDSMLSFDGNTAPYLQYAYTRIRSIFRRAEATGFISPDIGKAAISISEASEKNLLMLLLKFDQTVIQVAEDGFTHSLCAYLYDLASAFMTFYEHCPILKDEVDAATRTSRLQLCELSADTLKKGLELLGIETMEQM